MKSLNLTQKQGFYQRRVDERNLDLTEGKKLVEFDIQNADLEK